MNKVYDGIMGLIVGDALGVPYEFSQRDTFKADSMTGFGTYNQPPGTWSDDSSMTLATIDALIKSKCKLTGQFFETAMKNFAAWLNEGEFTPYSERFDVGNTTRRAIQKYVNGVSPYRCGCADINDNGNGSLMRILPFAYLNSSDSAIDSASSMTHAHDISKYACEVYVDIARNLLEDYTPAEAYTLTVHNVKNGFFNVKRPKEFNRICDLQKLSRSDIRSSGYVVDTLEAAIWCLITTENYSDCVMKAINLGGDTDTIAAVAGGLAGIVYGTDNGKGVPKEWVDMIPKKDYIKDLCDVYAAIITTGKDEQI